MGVRRQRVLELTRTLRHTTSKPANKDIVTNHKPTRTTSIIHCAGPERQSVPSSICSGRIRRSAVELVRFAKPQSTPAPSNPSRCCQSSGSGTCRCSGSSPSSSSRTSCCSISAWPSHGYASASTVSELFGLFRNGHWWRDYQPSSQLILSCVAQPCQYNQPDGLHSACLGETNQPGCT